MYFLTDPLAGLEELMILFVIGVVGGFVLLIYILYKLFNVLVRDKRTKQEETPIEKKP